MDCRDFHETYSDLLDGLLPESDEIRLHEHAAACAECRRFDRAYRLGVSVLQDLPYPRSSRAFTARVLNSVRNDSNSRTPSVASGFAGAALVAALVGVLVVDLRVIEPRGPVATAWLPDTTLAALPPDSGLDVVAGRSPREASIFAPPWDASSAVLVRTAGLPSDAPIGVSVAWIGR
jgi:anti-sigma factor RsiW